MFHNEKIQTEDYAIENAFKKAFSEKVATDESNKSVEKNTLREFADKLATPPVKESALPSVEEAKKSVENALKILQDAIDKQFKNK